MLPLVVITLEVMIANVKNLSVHMFIVNLVVAVQDQMVKLYVQLVFSLEIQSVLVLAICLARVLGLVIGLVQTQRTDAVMPPTLERQASTLVHPVTPALRTEESMDFLSVRCIVSKMVLFLFPVSKIR